MIDTMNEVFMSVGSKKIHFHCHQITPQVQGATEFGFYLFNTIDGSPEYTSVFVGPISTLAAYGVKNDYHSVVQGYVAIKKFILEQYGDCKS